MKVFIDEICISDPDLYFDIAHALENNQYREYEIVAREYEGDPLSRTAENKKPKFILTIYRNDNLKESKEIIKK